MPKEIVNEDFEFPEEFEHNNEPEVLHSKKVEAAPEIDVEVEIIDDTPEPDKGRKPLQAEAEAEQEEELENYSEKVQKRINQMSHKYHDERRAKEQAAREREEALKYAQAVYAENQRLMETLNWGQQEFAKMDMARLDAEQHVVGVVVARGEEVGVVGDHDREAHLLGEGEDLAVQLRLTLRPVGLHLQVVAPIGRGHPVFQSGIGRRAFAQSHVIICGKLLALVT